MPIQTAPNDELFTSQMPLSCRQSSTAVHSLVTRWIYLSIVISLARDATASAKKDLVHLKLSFQSYLLCAELSRLRPSTMAILTVKREVTERNWGRRTSRGVEGTITLLSKGDYKTLTRACRYVITAYHKQDRSIDKRNDSNLPAWVKIYK